MIDDDLFKRLVLLNQYNILAKVDRDDAASWEHAARVVRDNWPIDELPMVDWLKESAGRPFTADDRTFVYDVLDLHDFLQRAEDEGRAPAGYDPVVFPGFDGNGETTHMSFTRDVIDRQGKWASVRKASKDLNSHHPTLDMYDRMIAEWKRRGQSHHLKAEDYQAIVDARRHPGA